MNVRRALLGGLVGAAIVGAGGFVGCGGDAPTAPAAPAPSSAAADATTSANDVATEGVATPDGARLSAPDEGVAYPSASAPTGREALDEAARLGRPLLAILVPHESADRDDRARALDVLLQPDMVAARVPLVGAHVVALPCADLEAIAPGSSATAPFAVVVETDRRGAALQVIPWPEALAGPLGRVSFDVQHRSTTREESAPDRALWDLVRALDAALVGGAGTEGRRAAQRLAVGDADAEDSGDDARRLRRRRAEALASAWRAAPIPGTRWVPIPKVSQTPVAGSGAWCGTPGPRYRPYGWDPEPADDVELDDLEDGIARPRFGDLPRKRPGPSRRVPQAGDAEDGADAGLASILPRARLEFLPPMR